jgi:hypothetical protein
VAEQGIVLEDKPNPTVAHVPSSYVFVVKTNDPVSGIGLFKSGDNAQQGGLARTRRPQQNRQGASGHGQADVP